MARPARQRIVFAVSFLAILAAAAGFGPFASSARARVSTAGDRRGAIEGYQCHGCHAQSTPGIVELWQLGLMGQRGVNCYDCHGADPGDPDAVLHQGHLIAVLVTPADCGRCHPHEAAEQAASAHAHALDTLASARSEGGGRGVVPAAEAVGCQKCHGSRIALLRGGRLDPTTWPNSGIGRLNPDGSRGSCSPCHSRHRFSRAEARLPQACAACHQGAGQPQREAYEGSRHGALAETHRSRLNVELVRWVPGVDYHDAPTCATCHLGATSASGPTHNVSARLSWSLRGQVPERRPPPAGHTAMVSVCVRCHDARQVDGFFQQVDAALEAEREHLTGPARAIMAALAKRGLLTPEPLDEPLEWRYRELWHDAATRSRAGAAMGAPALAAGSGGEGTGARFQRDFLPELRRLAGEDLARELLQRHVPGYAAAVPAARRRP